MIRQLEKSRENVVNEIEDSMHTERQEICQMTVESHCKFNA